MASRIRWLLAALLAAGLVPPVSADTGDGRVSGQEVLEVLREEGYEATLDTDETGDPMIRVRMSDLKVFVLFYDCANAHCGSLQFMVGLDFDGGTSPAVVNAFNKTYRYATAYLDDENDPFLRYDFEVLHTRQREHIRSQIDTWKHMMDEFLDATGYRGDDA